jgi:hypothetical protein
LIASAVLEDLAAKAVIKREFRGLRNAGEPDHPNCTASPYTNPV